MLLQNKKVAVVGGGPGGLTLARLLQLKGVAVNVYERDRDRSARQQGATLDLHYESGLKALREAGLIAAFKQHYRPGAERFTITDSNAVVHYTERDEAPVEDLDNEYARPEIDRGPLRDLLMDSLYEDTMVWNSKLTGMERQGTGWKLVFENGTHACADLVVAADGANSVIRKFITGIPRVYSGITIVEGNIYHGATNAPRLWELTHEGKVYALGSGKTIVLSAKGEGSLSFYTSTREPEQWAQTAGIDFTDKEQVFTWFSQRFSDWSHDWHEIFSTSESYFVARPQYYFPVDQSWESLPNLTMLGDAAHVTPPSGEGVNQAMLDALELCEALCSGSAGTLHDAIRTYEEGMLLRASATTREAMDLIEGLHSETNLRYLLDFFHGVNALTAGK